MIRIGLTGSIGTGKSTISAMFRRAGVPVFDADAAVHRLIGKNGRALPAIAARFPGMVGDAGVDRKALGSLVFTDPNAKKALEAILHPLVRAAQTAWERRQTALNQPMIVFDIPLLFETGAERRFDIVVTTACSETLQRQRVLARPGMTTEKFTAIKAQQTPQAEKRRLADWVIDTGLGKRPALDRVRRLVHHLRQGKKP